MEMDKNETASEIAMNPRKNIDGLLNAVQVDLDEVEKRLAVINEQLLGSIPEDRLKREEANKTKATRAMGWFNQIIEMLHSFGSQLQGIKKLETNLERSIAKAPELEEERKF